MSIAGGVSWQEVLEPVKEVSTWWVFLFLFFISFLSPSSAHFPYGDGSKPSPNPW